MRFAITRARTRDRFRPYSLPPTPRLLVFRVFCREFGSFTRYRKTVSREFAARARPAPASAFSLFTTTADAAATVLIWQLVSFPRRFVPRCHPADLKSVEAIWILPTSDVDVPLSVARARARASARVLARRRGMGGREGAKMRRETVCEIRRAPYRSYLGGIRTARLNLSGFSSLGSAPLRFYARCVKLAGECDGVGS